MADNSIEQTRQALEQAKQSAEVQSDKRQAFIPRSERTEREAFKRDVSVEQQKFETDVAKSKPEQATPEALDRAYQEAKAGVQSLYNNSLNQVQSLKDKIKAKEVWWGSIGKKERSKKSRRDNYNNYKKKMNEKVEAQTAKTQSLQRSLSTDKVGMVKNYFSGYTSNVASYAKEKSLARYEASQSQQEAQQKAVQEYQSKWKSEGSKLGMKPMFSKSGDIIGFEDSRKQMSYNLEQLGIQRPESLEQLKKAGLISYETTIPERQKIDLSGETDIFGFSQKTYVPEKKTSRMDTLIDWGILPNLEPIKERVSKVKSWYQDTGKFKAEPIIFVDKEGKPTGEKMLVGVEKTKGGVLKEKVITSDIYKGLTKSQKSELERKQYYGLLALGAGALTFGASTAIGAGVAVPSFLVTGAKGAGLYAAGKVVKPEKSEILYGTSGIIEKGAKIGLYGLGTGLQTAGEFTLAGPAIGGIVGKAPRIAKTAGVGLGGLYTYGKGKEALQAESLTELGLVGAEVIGEVAAFRPLKGYKQRRIYKNEIKNYEKALKEFKSLKKSAKMADTVIEKPFTSVGKLRIGDLDAVLQEKLIRDVGKLNLPKNIKTNLEGIEIKQSYNEVISRVPKMNKINVPKTSPLYKKQKYVYQNVVNEVTKYKNIVTYDLIMKDGKYVSYSVASFSNKPLTRFRNIENALKYGSGKKLIVSSPYNKDFVGSQLYDIRGGKFKPTDKFITKPKMYKVGDELIQGAESVRVGKAMEASPGMSIEELYVVSPKAGKIISKKKITKLDKIRLTEGGLDWSYKEFLTKEVGISKGYKLSDTSLLNKLIRERAKYFAKIKPAKIKALTPSQRNIEVAKIDREIKIIKNRIKPAPASRPITILESPTTLTTTRTSVVQSIPIRPQIRTRTIPKPTKIGTIDTLISSVIPVTRTVQKTKQKSKRKTRTKQVTGVLTDSLFGVALAEATVTAQKTKKIQKLASKGRFKTRTRTVQTPITMITPSTYSPRIQQPIVRPIFPLIDDFERPKKKKKIFKKKKKPVKKKRKFALRKTGFQAALGLKATKARALPDITGFEMFR